MNAACILYGLLSTFDGPVVAPAAAPGHESPIEIVIAGPEQARNDMAAAIRPLLGSDPGIRWVAQDGISPDRVFPVPGGPAGNEREIWIDVSSPVRLRVYLPASAPQGATTIRTLPRAGVESDASDLLALEAVAQIVKAAILSLRREPTTATGLSPSPTDGASSAIITKRPEAAKGPSDSSPSAAHSHDGFFLRLLAGYGSVRASQSDGIGSYDHYGPTIGVAVGASLPKGFILYGELRMNGTLGTSDTGAYPNPKFMLYNFGPGVAYYFDMNLHVSASLGLTKLAFDQGPDPDLGYSATITGGKEWWVSSGWALGVAGQVSMATMDDYRPSLNTVPATLHVTCLSLLFSATYD
jgi:hypothetical protein